MTRINESTRQEIERQGNRLVDEIAAICHEQHLHPEDATCETAGTYTDLGLVFTSLLAGQYIDEQDAFNLITRGINALLRDEYGEFC